MDIPLAPSRRDPVWANWFFRVAICVGLGVLVYFTVESLIKRYPWDLKVYQEAMALYLAGHSPYVVGPGMNFVYPPVFLSAFSWAGSHFGHLLLTLYAAGLTLLARKSMRPVVMGLALFTLTVFFHTRPAVIALGSGNLTFFCHVGLILAWREGGKMRAWVFPALIVLFSTLKPYYLAYALVPVMVQGLGPAVLVRLTGVVAVTGMAWVAQYLADPETFRQFLAALRMQSFKGEASLLSGDIGWGFYRFLAPVSGGSANVALGLHAVLSTLCVGAVMRWRRWLAAWGGRQGVDALGLVALIVVILVNPRLKIYDYCFIGSMAAYLVAFLLRDCRKIWLILIWLAMHFAEKKVGPQAVPRFLDAHFLTVVLVALLVRTGMAKPSAVASESPVEAGR